ncbi:SH3 domain-containing protein [Terrisporobacter mayombei]|nr:SH3 domain-containing protein [Terrisporobacter mayombei]
MKKTTKSFLVLSLSITMVSQNVIFIANAEEITKTNIGKENSLLSINLNNEAFLVEPDPKENPTYNMGLPNSTYSKSSRSMKNLPVTPITKPNVIGLGKTTAETLNVRSGPSTSYDKIGTLVKDSSIEVLEKNRTWYKISFEDNVGYISSSYVKLNPIEKGIDVSKWNGTIDWNKVKASGIDYVIIRAGYGSKTIDPQFRSYIEGASKAGLKIGVYWFSYAYNVEMAKNEARVCLETIAPYKNNITYPVYFDFEYDSIRYANDNGATITKSLATEMANTFLNEVEKQGYTSGIYTNKDFGDRYFSEDLLLENNLWVAQYSDNCTYNRPYMMWQYTDQGTIDGINSTKFDMNYTFLKPTSDNSVSNPTKENIEDASVDKIDSQVYTGKEIKPDVKLTLNGQELKLGTDYEVNYSNNINVGVANVIITGIGGYEGTIKTTFEIVNFVPNIVTNLSLTKKTSNSIQFSWSKLDTVDGYEVERYDSNSKTYKKLSDVTDNSYTDMNLNSATFYKYRVRAYKLINGNYHYGDYSDIFTEVTNVEKVSNLKLNSKTTTSLDISWSKINNSTGYEVYKYDSNSNSYKLLNKIISNSTTSYKDSGLKPNTSYSYKIRAYEEINSKVYYGEFSSVLDAKTDAEVSVIKTGVTKSNLNVRKGPSTSYSILGTLASGSKVEIVGTDSKTGWYKIKYKNDYGYVSNDYITIQNSSNDTNPPASTTTLGVTKSNLNVRKGPSTSYSILGTLTSGSKVEIVATDSKTGWYKIKYKNDYGYISNDYVTVQNSSNDTNPPASTTKSGVAKSNLNVRKGPYTSYDILGTLASGTKVEIVGTDSKTGWYKIKYKNDYGYVSNDYITIQNISNNTNPPASTTKSGVAKSNLNVRKGPSTSYTILGTLASGTKVEIVGTDSKTGWYKIKYKNDYGYVSNSYITIK